LPGLPSGWRASSSGTTASSRSAGKRPSPGKLEFVEGVLELCREAGRRDPLILARQRRCGASPSPNTLNG
jgi:hypothetical protein